MEDKRSKPLRPTTSDKQKDLYSAYMNDPGGRTIPITSPEDETEESLKSDEPNEEINIDDVNEELLSQTEEEDIKQMKKEKKDRKEKKIDDLKEKIEVLEKERNELKEQVLRKTAELDNTLRRTLKEKNEIIDYGNKGLLQLMLPMMDDFAKALEAGQKSDDYKSLLMGLEMIYQKAQKTFLDAGVKKMEIQQGDEFNVDLHEALMQMPSADIDDGCIIQVAQDGFMYRDKVLRHAKVITSSGKPEKENKEEVMEESVGN